MCGIFGAASKSGAPQRLTDHEAIRLRDMLTRRGPDDAGLWRDDLVTLTHRRLAVIDPSPAGAQPMHLGDLHLVYNGELYNDSDLRAQLGKLGVRFSSHSDTETLLHAWATWGTQALARLRGMFAFAMYDSRLKTVTLVRDPLGIKPLSYWSDGNELAFASEAFVLAKHPRVSARPDLAMVSAYLTTIRTTMGDRTLFDGIRAVRPGEMVQFDLSGSRIVAQRKRYWQSSRVRDELDLETASSLLRTALEESVSRHLRADVPVCSLLSGGLDSTIIASLAHREHPSLQTYAAGAPLPPECRLAGDQTDLYFAARVAEQLGTRHSEAHVTRAMFAERWEMMVGKLGVPLSTPNEVAIHAVAARLRADGCVVTLSGEGADELFAGYEGPMRAAMAAVRDAGQDVGTQAMHALYASAWVNAEMKAAVLNESVRAELDNDAWLHGWYTDEFRALTDEAGGRLIEAHLRMQRRVNLAGLLQRLDTATMIAGVEGRTPIADVRIAELAESLPMGLKFSIDEDEWNEGGVAVATKVRTKIALREAFRDVVPAEVMERPKASFPLPFQGWMADSADVLDGSGLVGELFNGAAIAAVRSQPEKLWNLAWPMMNLARWGRVMGW